MKLAEAMKLCETEVVIRNDARQKMTMATESITFGDGKDVVLHLTGEPGSDIELLEGAMYITIAGVQMAAVLWDEDVVSLQVGDTLKLSLQVDDWREMLRLGAAC